MIKRLCYVLTISVPAMCPPTNNNNTNRDRTLHHTWFNTHTAPISPIGLDNIAQHIYKSGQYTYLDNVFNPLWNTLTECLPLWLAPNMITTLGGLLVLSSYVLIWYHSPNWDVTAIVPSYVLIYSGICILLYYTLDCMDGKQARRTGTSSPLGQLFDHGVDCLCCLLQFGAVGAFTLSGGSRRILALQYSTQFTFYIAQWEEYYTHVLEHAQGKYFGVTELNYGMGLVIMLHGCVDYQSFWYGTLCNLLPSSALVLLPDYLHEWTVLEAGSVVWVATMIFCLLASIRRVYRYVGGFNWVFGSAMAKLLSPVLLLCAFWIPSEITAAHTRYVAIAMGSLFCLLSIKVIVYSMAKMSCAVIQKEILPFLVLCLWFWYDSSISIAGSKVFLVIISVWNFFCLISWARNAVLQICHRLDIHCFTIKPKVKIQ